MLENDKFKNGVDYYHRLNFVFNLIIAVPLVPFTLLYLGKVRGMIPGVIPPEPYDLLADVLLTAVLIMIGFHAIRHYQADRDRIQLIDNLRQKLIEYHHCLLSIYLKLALAGFVSITGFFVTQSNVHVVTFVVLLIVFSLKRPSLKHIVEELALKGEHAEILRNRADIV